MEDGGAVDPAQLAAKDLQAVRADRRDERGDRANADRRGASVVTGCATDAYAIAHPAGVDASVADAVTSCVAGVISRSRYSCLASKRLRPGCP